MSTNSGGIRSRRLSALGIAVIALGLGAVATTSAADQESTHRHSLLHRPMTETKAPAQSEQNTAVSSSSGQTSLHRKLTRRPFMSVSPVPLQPAQLNQPAQSLPVQTSGQGTAQTAAAQSATISPAPAITPSTTPGIAAASIAPTLGTGSSTPAPSGARAPLASASSSAPVAAANGRGASSSRGSRSALNLMQSLPIATLLQAPTVVVSPPSTTPTPPTPPPPAPTPPTPPPTPPPSTPPPTSPPPTPPAPTPPPTPPPSTPPPTPPTPPPPTTGSVTLSWNLGSESDLAGYKVFVGTGSGNYNYPGSPFSIGRTNTFTLSDLPSGQTYFFAVAAFDTSSNQSGLSGEVSKSIY